LYLAVAGQRVVRGSQPDPLRRTAANDSGRTLTRGGPGEGWWFDG